MSSISHITTSRIESALPVPRRKSRAKIRAGWHSYELGFSERHPEFLPRLAKSYPTLTVTELQICALLYESHSSLEIAAVLAVSERTIENHRSVIRRKLGVVPRMSLPIFLLRSTV